MLEVSLAVMILLNGQEGAPPSKKRVISCNNIFYFCAGGYAFSWEDQEGDLNPAERNENSPLYEPTRGDTWIYLLISLTLSRWELHCKKKKWLCPTSKFLPPIAISCDVRILVTVVHHIC